MDIIIRLFSAIIAGLLGFLVIYYVRAAWRTSTLAEEADLAWQAVAERLGLEYSFRYKGSQLLRGEHRGRKISLRWLPRTGEDLIGLGIYYLYWSENPHRYRKEDEKSLLMLVGHGMRIKVGLEGKTNRDLIFTHVQHMKWLGKLFPRQPKVRIGDEHFDDHFFIIESFPEEFAGNVFSRRNWREFLVENLYADDLRVEVDHEHVIYEQEGLINTPEELLHLIDVLCDFAERVEEAIAKETNKLA